MFKELIGETEVAGVWNDMNEPAIFEVPSKTFPNDVRHDYDGHPCSHRKAHNVYGMQMARATYSGMRQFGYPQRPFVLTRSAYSGAQRFTATWTGDSIASWEHLWVANVQCQRMSLSGYSFIGSDIGGFTEHPSSELYIRWMQLGVFHPFCRTHSSGDHGDQEPWSFGENALNIVRKFIRLRYKLLPYLYTAFYRSSTEGIPMLQPLFAFDQEDTETHHRIDEFILGNRIFVCPVLEPNTKGRYLYLPRGEWYNYWDDQVDEGGSERWVDAPLQRIPVYVRAGSIIPCYPVTQSIDLSNVKRLELNIYLAVGTHEDIVYEDAGDGYEYRHGKFLTRKLKLEVDEEFIQVFQRREGSFDPSYDECRIIWHGIRLGSRIVEVDNRSIEATEVNFDGRRCLEMVVPQDFGMIRIDRRLQE